MGRVVRERSILSSLRVGVIAAALAAALWPAVELLGSCPVCWLSWVAGGLVSVSFLRVGLRGIRAGLLAGLLTILAVGAGKLLVVSVDVRTIADREFPRYLSRQEYDRVMWQADVYARIEKDGDLGEFMNLMEYGAEPSAAPVTPQDVAEFRREAGPELLALNAQRPTYEEWREHRLDRVTPILREQVPLLEKIQMSFGLLDGVFLALGVTTAYGLVRRRGIARGRPENNPYKRSSTIPSESANP